MTDLIDNIIKREGGDKETNDPNDAGGRTKYGISERAHPEVWIDGIVTNEEARKIFEAKYIKGPGFNKIKHEALKEQLVDYGVLSGPGIAIKALQSLVGAETDGILGPDTLAKANAVEPVWLNNQLVSTRVRMIGRIVAKNPSQLKFLNGWLNRALEFLI